MTTARDMIAEFLLKNWNIRAAGHCADQIISVLQSAPESARLELAALLNPWRPIGTATEEDKDGYVLGFVMGTDIPMIAFWDDDENRWFALNGAFTKEWNPTHFQRLSMLPLEDKT